MKKVFYIFLLLIAGKMIAQPDDSRYKNIYIKALQLYKAGRYQESEEMTKQLLTNKNDIKPINIFTINNLLANIYNEKGLYDDAEAIYKKNIVLLSLESEKFFIDEAYTYNNLASVYKNQGKYSNALDYYEKAVYTIYSGNFSLEKQERETEYLFYNIGIIYGKLKDYKKALQYYETSFEIKRKYKLDGIDKIYYNQARIYRKLKMYEESERLFKKALNIRENKYGKNYRRLASIYLELGDLLTEKGDFTNARKFIDKGNSINKKFYGEHHPYTASAFVSKGDYYAALNMLDSALYSYQLSLIANSNTFKSEDLEHNPNSNSCISGLQLLTTLKNKAELLQRKAAQANDNDAQKFYLLSLNSLNTALLSAGAVKNNYVSEDNKLILAETEKTLFSLAVEASYKLFDITGNTGYLKFAYAYATASKAGILSSALKESALINQMITNNENLRMNSCEKRIQSYKVLIYEENEKPEPDSTKIAFWKSTLTDEIIQYETFMLEIKKKYRFLSGQNKFFISPDELRSELDQNTTCIEYFISGNQSDSLRRLYIFALNKDTFKCVRTEIDNSFKDLIHTYKQNIYNTQTIGMTFEVFENYIHNLHSLESVLFHPIESEITGTNILVIPDEEIAFISFESLIKDLKSMNSVNFSALHYLIRDYCFSYAYSAPLWFENKNRVFPDSLYAFAPEYNDDTLPGQNRHLSKLEMTYDETLSISSYFKGVAFIGKNARKDTFEHFCNRGAVLHLAGHAFSNPEQRDFSWFAFSDDPKKEGNNKLYAYEIESASIRSPMVVLSACSSGSGQFYEGEGVMSLSRSFIKSGVPSVVLSLWDVNDNAGNDIMTKFYSYLDEGLPKNIALRKAKLEYIDSSPPSLVNPGYWAGYIINGDISPLKNDQRPLYYITSILSAIAFVIIFLLIRRKILTKRVLFSWKSVQ